MVAKVGGKEFKAENGDWWDRTPTMPRGQGRKLSHSWGLEVWGFFNQQEDLEATTSLV